MLVKTLLSHARRTFFAGAAAFAIISFITLPSMAADALECPTCHDLYYSDETTVEPCAEFGCDSAKAWCCIES